MKKVFALVITAVLLITAAAVCALAADYHNASFDGFYTNRGLDGEQLNFGDGDGSASGKLDAHNRTVDSSDGSVKNVAFRGWIGFEQELEAIGYKINDNDPVFVDGAISYDSPDIAAVQAEGNGGKYAARFDLTVPTDGLTGTNTIVVVAKAGGDLFLIDENAEASGAATVPNTRITFKGPGGEGGDSGDHGVSGGADVPATGDGSMAVFAAAAALAFGAAVFARRREF